MKGFKGSRVAGLKKRVKGQGCRGRFETCPYGSKG